VQQFQFAGGKHQAVNNVAVAAAAAAAAAESTIAREISGDDPVRDVDR